MYAENNLYIHKRCIVIHVLLYKDMIYKKYVLLFFHTKRQVFVHFSLNSFVHTVQLWQFFYLNVVVLDYRNDFSFSNINTFNLAYVLQTLNLQIRNQHCYYA